MMKSSNNFKYTNDIHFIYQRIGQHKIIVLRKKQFK